jgi:hypothetical protein
MLVTVLAVIALLVVILLAGGIGFIHSLITRNKTMQGDTKTKAIDIFVYLGIAIALITSVTNLLQIIFTAIDRRFTDMFAQGTYVDVTQSDVRLAIASLVVMFPIYVGLSWLTARNISKYLYKQDLPVRKFMIYGTLFITVLTLIGTLVSVIYTYLGGELSIRFGLKALTVFLVALFIFWYYYFTVRRDYSKKTSLPVVATVAATLVVIFAVVWSISVIGSPKEMRAKKIDSVRLSDISRIQQELLNRVQVADKLPQTLSELDNAFQGYQVPTDPVTKAPYKYVIMSQPVIKMNYTTNKKELTSPAVFELCATFDTVRNIDARGQTIPVNADADGTTDERFYSASNQYYDGDMSPFWNHGTGDVCFKRVITSDMYYGK